MLLQLIRSPIWTAKDGQPLTGWQQEMVKSGIRTLEGSAVVPKHTNSGVPNPPSLNLLFPGSKNQEETNLLDGMPNPSPNTNPLNAKNSPGALIWLPAVNPRHHTGGMEQENPPMFFNSVAIVSKKNADFA